MAEPFSLAVGGLSLIGIMKDIKEAASGCAAFLESIKHAKSDLQYLSNEVNMLHMLLNSTANDMEQISYLSPEESSSAVWHLAAALEDYRKAVVSFKALVDELESCRSNEANPSVGARFKFVRGKERIEKYRERINTHIHFLGIQQQIFHELVNGLPFHVLI